MVLLSHFIFIACELFTIINKITIAETTNRQRHFGLHLFLCLFMTPKEAQAREALAFR